jgi:hypothetical protein
MDTIWTGIIILCLLIIIGLIDWARCERRKQRARRISKAVKPVDYTTINFAYDNKARIKQVGHELRELSYRKEEGKCRKENSRPADYVKATGS